MHFFPQITYLTMVGTELVEDGQGLDLLLPLHPQQLHGGEEALDKEAQSFSHIDLCSTSQLATALDLTNQSTSGCCRSTNGKLRYVS